MVGNQPGHVVTDGWESQPGCEASDGWENQYDWSVDIIPTSPWPHTWSRRDGIRLRSFGYNTCVKTLVSMIGGIRFEA